MKAMPSLWETFHRRIAFSTNAFKKTTLEDAVATIGRLGYAGCEIMADQPHFTPSELSSNDALNMQQLLEDQNLVCSNVNAFTGFFAATHDPTGDTYHPTWITPDDEAQQVRIGHTLSCIRLATVVGAKTVSLQPGGPTIGTGQTREQAEKRFADGVKKVLPTARELGITLAVEPEPGLLLQTTGEYMAWKRTYFPTEPAVSMNFDVGHAFCVMEDPAEVARTLAGEYAHVHLEDIAASRVHSHLVPGEGAIDFVALFEALLEVKYKGWVTIELYPFMTDAAGVAEGAIAYLRKLLGG